MLTDGNWSQGYVTDTIYTESFFRELSPAWLNYVAALNGCHPRRLDKEFTYIELGCGLGQSVNVLAAAFPNAAFYGVDFNPAHIDAAQRYATRIGIPNAQFLERSFQALSGVALPDFDFIALHGVYSWISAEARQAVQRFIFEKLKPGGLVYNSYNCLPGWAADAPIRRLVYEFGSTVSGGSTHRVEQATKQINELKDLKTGYFRVNPQSAQQVDNLLKRQTNYLAHEYLNADWTLFYAADVADEMAAAKLDFLGSATLIENHLDLVLADAPAAFVRKQPTERLRQMMQDFCSGQRFRRDVFVRGHAHLTRTQISRNLWQTHFGTVKSMEDFTQKAKVPRGEITFDDTLFPVLKEELSFGSLKLEEIIAAVKKKSGKVGDAERAITLFAAAGHVVPMAQPFRASKMPATITKAKIKSPINQAIVTLAAETFSRRALVSSVAGTGVNIEPIDVAILTTLISSKVAPNQLAERIVAELKQRGVRINKQGEELKDDKAAAAHVNDLTTAFLTKGLPLLARLGIVDVG